MHEQTTASVRPRGRFSSTRCVHEQNEILVGTAERYAAQRRLKPYPLTRAQVRRLVPIRHELNMLVHVPKVPQLPPFHVCRWRIHVDTAKRRSQAESPHTRHTPWLRHELPELALRQVNDLTQGAAPSDQLVT